MGLVNHQNILLVFLLECMRQKSGVFGGSGVVLVKILCMRSRHGVNLERGVVCCRCEVWCIVERSVVHSGAQCCRSVLLCNQPRKWREKEKR
jgi:hypothetical protein